MLQIPLTMLPLGVCKKTGTHPNRPELVVLKGTGPVPGSLFHGRIRPPAHLDQTGYIIIIY